MSNILFSTLKGVKRQGKVQPFGAHFTTRLHGVNSKLICALSQDDGKGGQDTGCDDHKGMSPEEQAILDEQRRMEEERRAQEEAERAKAAEADLEAEKQRLEEEAKLATEAAAAESATPKVVRQV